MAFTITIGYTWVDGEVVTAAKLNLAGVPTIADGQTYTFGAGAAATPSINFTGGTTTGFYLGTTAIGFSVGAVSIATLSYAGTNTSFNLDAPATTNSASFTFAASGTAKWNVGRGATDGSNDFIFYSNAVSAITARFSSAAHYLALAGDFSVANGLYRVTSNVTYPATTTLADITGLSATLVAGATYDFRAKLLGSGAAVPTAGGIKVALSGTATATSLIASIAGSFGTSATTPYFRSVVTALNSAASNTPTVDTQLDMVVEGSIVVNTGGTFTIQAAQVTASGVTTVGAGSTLWLQRLT